MICRAIDVARTIFVMGFVWVGQHRLNIKVASKYADAMKLKVANMKTHAKWLVYST
jgi:hypothetical protein